MLPDSSKPVLLFDGVCNLCNSFVQTIIKHDRRGIFRFASLQSGMGQQVRAHIVQHEGRVPDSLILLHRGRYYTQSAAALKTALLLGGAWRLFGLGYILPPFARNAIYALVARNRYKWFGRKQECMVPTPELKQRFLD